MNEKLQELGWEGKSSDEVNPDKNALDFGFYVADMTGKQWLNTIGDLGTSVWENATLPENYWNEDKGSKTNNVRMPALFTGVSDGVIGEVTEYPQLIKPGYDVATKEQVRTGLWNSAKNISIESIKNASINFYEEKKANYTSDKPFVLNHTLGKDGVQLASMFFGAGGVKKAVKNVDEGVEKAGKEILTEVDDVIVKELNGADNLAKKLTKEAIDNGDFDKEIVESLTNEANDIAVKKGRKLSWEEVKALFKRGNDFNKKADIEQWYEFNEVTLSNGKRLDSYDLIKKEIVSRKATDLEKIKLETFEGYLKELKSKYPIGEPINAPKYGERLKGKILEGKQILEIPESNRKFSKIQEYIDLAKSDKYKIEIRFRPE